MHPTPHISIVIPCRNERDYIGRCLDSIIRCDYDKSKLDVWVCDGLSDDGTIGIIKNYALEYPFIHYLENPHMTTPHALNTGLKAMPFDIGIILGAHAEIYPDYLSNCVRVFHTHPEVDCVGGIIENENENEKSEAIGAAMSSVFGVGNAHFRTGTKSGFVDTVAFGAYKKEVFETCGYFDEELVRNQDDEFNFRITSNGYKIWLEPSVRSKYYVRASFGKLRKQYYQYGYWKVYVNKKHGTVTTWRQTVPALWIAFLFLGYIPCLFLPPLWYGYLGTVVFYISASFLMAVKTAPELRLVPKVLLSFWLLHLSYGSGYIKGLWDFFLLGKKPAEKQGRLSR